MPRILPVLVSPHIIAKLRRDFEIARRRYDRPNSKDPVRDEFDRGQRLATHLTYERIMRELGLLGGES